MGPAIGELPWGVRYVGASQAPGVCARGAWGADVTGVALTPQPGFLQGLLLSCVLDAVRREADYSQGVDRGQNPP